MPHDPRSRLARQAAAARKREAEARLEAEALEGALARMMRQIDAMDAAAVQYQEARGLRKVHAAGKLGTVTPEAASIGSKVSQAKTKQPWPWSRALHAHGSSPAQWAEAKAGRPKPETARAWLKRPGKGGRPTPRYWANEIETEYAGTETPVPAINASWPNGIREEP